MKLYSIQLSNFRQFYGQTPKVELASGSQNVTIFHGANGSGKTTILNAMTWLFYNRFTDAFAAPDHLINKKAIRDASVGSEIECWVELFFENHGRKYVVRRTQVAKKESDLDEGVRLLPVRVTMGSCGEDGRWEQKDETEIPDVVGRILPEKLLPYFFFDGERIESLQRSSKQPDVIAATTMLVGEEVINRAISHLDGARKQFESELKAIGDSEISDLIDLKSEKESKWQEAEKELEQLRQNLQGYRVLKESIEDSLRDLKGVEELQRRRDDLSERYEELKSTLAESRITLSDLVGAQGYQVYLQPAVHSFRDIISGLRKRGQLPASIKTTFVEELLREGACICGRELAPGGNAYSEVEGWLHRGGMSDVEETALRMEAEVNQLDRQVGDLFSGLDKHQDARKKARAQISRVEDELEKISNELRESSQEDARALQAKLDDVNDKIFETHRKEAELEHEIRALDDEISYFEKEIAKRQGRTAEQQLAQRRLKACQEAREALLEVRTNLRTNFRLDLSERINELFGKMSFKPYTAVLDENYSLRLEDLNGQVVGASTGESALLSLSFIGAVIDQARELTSRRDRLPGPDSSQYPIVMDSPFGSLDPIYRQQVAKHIPELANQVVIMVSKTQFQGEVENTMHQKVGKEYVLTYHSPKSDAHEDRIHRNGQVYDLIQRSTDGFEWTEIREVAR